MNKLTAALLAFAACASALAGEPVKKQLDADPEGQVVVDVTRGKVVIEGWDQNVVSVDGTLDEDSEGFVMERDGKVINIEDEARFNTGHDDRGTNIVVKVPRGSSVKVSVVSADLEARDIGGGARLETVSGEIVAERIGREAKLETVSGDIKLRASAPRIELQTVSGDIEAHNDGALADGKLSTVSGDGVFDCELGTEGDLELDSISGDLNIMLRGDTNARVRVETGPGGDINNDLSDEEPRKQKYVGSESLDMKVGSGGADIDVSTVSGTVSLKKH